MRKFALPLLSAIAAIGASKLIEHITKTHHPLFCATYRNLGGNRVYSIINDSNQANYENVFEHGVIYGE